METNLAALFEKENKQWAEKIERQRIARENQDKIFRDAIEASKQLLELE